MIFWSWFINLFNSQTKGNINMNWITLFEAVLNAVVIVAKDAGKSWDQILVDVVNHLTPGKPNAPALS